MLLEFYSPECNYHLVLSDLICIILEHLGNRKQNSLSHRLGHMFRAIMERCLLSSDSVTGIGIRPIYLSIYLSIYLWLYNPLLDLGRFLSFLILYTVGRTPWMGDQAVARPLPAHRTTQIQNNTDIRALSGIRTHDPSVRASEDS
jgi:hypothetical protein